METQSKKEVLAGESRLADRLWRQKLELPGLIALGLLGAGIGLGVLSIGGFGPKPWTESVEFRVWGLLVVAQTATWVLAAAVLLSPPMLNPIRGIYADARRSVRTFVLAAAVPLVGFAVLGPALLTVDYPLPGSVPKSIVLNLLGAAVALLGVAEMALVKAALQGEPARGGAADLDRFLELRSVLQRVLAVVGAILGAAILATGARRNAANAYPDHLRAYIHGHPGYLQQHQAQKSFLNTALHAPFPHEYLLFFGAFLTLLLALFYAPVYLRLLETGRANLEAACPLGDPASAGWADSYEKRKKLQEYLQLEVSASASFRAGVAIFAPLGSALLALLLGTG
jgi:hypothetical protein